MSNPHQVSFFDLGEDGKLDILVMTNETKSNGGSFISRTSIVNNVKDDTLLIKILPLSISSKYEDEKRKISTAFGVTLEWRITLLDGNKKIQLDNQRFQLNYGMFQLPYVILGLGRTNNYVEDFHVGYNAIAQNKEWSPIIPNSQLIVYKTEDEWKLETFLSNSERVNYVIYISIGILVLLGLVIALLNRRENLEDKKDHYNFVQLVG